MTDDPIHDDSIERRRRPDRDVALALLAGRNKPVGLRRTEMVEDADGFPAGTSSTEVAGTLAVTPEAIGWTWEELGVNEEDYE